MFIKQNLQPKIDPKPRGGNGVMVAMDVEERDEETCWKKCPKVRYRSGDRRRCDWRAVCQSLCGCFCCYFDCCPLRAFLLAISSARIFQYLCLYIWHTHRIQEFYVLYYTTNYLQVGHKNPIPKSRTIFEFCWHSVEMGMCLIQMCLHTRLFTGALLVFPQMGWIWFHWCWAVSFCSAIMSCLVLWFFPVNYHVQSGWNIVLSTAVVLYEMWLWAFYSKQIRTHGDTYKGIHAFVPEVQRAKSSLNPRIFAEVKQKVPFDVYHGWNDNSYSLAQEFILANNRYTSSQRPRTTYTKLQLSKRMTGLTNQELDDAVEEYYNPKKPMKK